MMSNLLSYLIKTFKFKADWSEKTGSESLLVTQELFRIFFPKAIFTISAMTQGIFRKLFPKSKLPNKIWNSENSGNGAEEFPETISTGNFPDIEKCFQILKKVSGKASESWPELSITDKGPDFVQRYLSGTRLQSGPIHDPFLWENIFWWVSTHEIDLEIVSVKSPASLPEIAKSGKSLVKVSGISPVSPPVFGNSFRELPISYRLYGLRPLIFSQMTVWVYP